MTHLALLLANYVHIFLRAFQQRNVAHLRYWPVLPLSLLLAMTEVYMIAQVGILAVTEALQWHHILVIALGGGLGCMTSMWAHGRIFK